MVQVLPDAARGGVLETELAAVLGIGAGLGAGPFHTEGDVLLWPGFQDDLAGVPGDTQGFYFPGVNAAACVLVSLFQLRCLTEECPIQEGEGAEPPQGVAQNGEQEHQHNCPDEPHSAAGFPLQKRQYRQQQVLDRRAQGEDQPGQVPGPGAEAHHQIDCENRQGQEGFQTPAQRVLGFGNGNARPGACQDLHGNSGGDHPQQKADAQLVLPE